MNHDHVYIYYNAFLPSVFCFAPNPRIYIIAKIFRNVKFSVRNFEAAIDFFSSVLTWPQHLTFENFCGII